MARTFNTINSLSIFRALNAPGRPVRDYTAKIAKEVKVEAELTSPINNVLNAGHRGGIVGRYKEAWRVAPSRRNTLQEVTIIVVNRVGYADIVEKGKPYVRKRQVFTWEHAVGASRRYGFRGAKGRFVTAGQGRPACSRPKNPGGRVSTKVVHAWGYKSVYNPTPAPRRGHRVLENATNKIAREHGLRRDIKLIL